MATLVARSLADGDRREFDRGRLDVVAVDGHQVGRFTLSPGWRWSESVAALAGTEWCEVAHLGYVVEGRLHVVMRDGTEGEAGPGDAYSIGPGHDAWVVGARSAVLIDVVGAPTYAVGVDRAVQA